MILSMNYTDWAGELTIDKLIDDMRIKKIHILPNIANYAVFDMLI